MFIFPNCTLDYRAHQGLTFMLSPNIHYAFFSGILGQRDQGNQKGRRSRKGQKRGQENRRAGRRNQFENNNLEILSETELAKVMENLLEEIKSFNKEVEKIQLEGEKPEKLKERIKEGRVLPPLLRSLQLLLQRYFVIL